MGVCSVVSLDSGIHGYMLHYLNTSNCYSAELFVLWFHNHDGKDFRKLCSATNIYGPATKEKLNLEGSKTLIKII